jgi:hypothetical protein
MRYPDANRNHAANVERKDIQRGLAKKRRELQKRLRRIDLIIERLYGTQTQV